MALLDQLDAPLAPPTMQDGLARRRLVVLALNLALAAALTWAMATVLFSAGLSMHTALMFLGYLVTLPWLTIGFWNGVLGFAILNLSKDPAAAVNPHLAGVDPAAPIRSKTALAMAIRNEDVPAVMARLAGMQRDLADAGVGHLFDVHVLSDTNRPEIAAEEEAAIARWREEAPALPRIHYRRRTENAGFKAGNIEEFVGRTHQDYDFFLPLDADSRMSAAAMLRLVRVMEARPQIGLLQSLVVGAPSETLFTRLFQFGMRHGMRAYTVGGAWWQGDCGPYWGHNALIRMDAFHRHCKLPVLSGAGPFGGHILSHDQVEAVLMRRAGYEVRVLAEEGESWEENPPSLPDFIKREIRWCQGNFQYVRLLGIPGLKPVSRLQLVLAILMYAAAPAWMMFIICGATLAATTHVFSDWATGLGLVLFAAIMAINLTPKLMGLAETLTRPGQAARYGGRARVALGGLVEILASMLIAPAVAVALTLCCVGLAFGRRIKWDAQSRSTDGLTWAEAARAMWPQTVLGVVLSTWLFLAAPYALVFGLPVLLGLCLSIPTTAVTTWPSMGAWSRRIGLFDIPEDRGPVTDLGRHPKAA